MLPFSCYWSRARRPVSALVPLAAALLFLGISMALHALVPPRGGPVYSVGALWARVHRDPDRWVGRTVRLYAVAERCASPISDSVTACIDPRPALFDAASQPRLALLLLPEGAAAPLRAWLRRLPLVGSLVPAPPAPRWDAPAVYRIQLRARPCSPAPPVPQPQCYEALLLDAGSSPLTRVRER